MSQVLVSQPGPLPIKLPISWPSDRTVLVSVSGSAFAQQPGTMLGVKLAIHTTLTGTLQLMANHANMHMDLPTAFFAIDGDFGDTSIQLDAVGGTVTDENDVFTVALIY